MVRAPVPTVTVPPPIFRILVSVCVPLAVVAVADPNATVVASSVPVSKESVEVRLAMRAWLPIVSVLISRSAA